MAEPQPESRQPTAHQPESPQHEPQQPSSRRPTTEERRARIAVGAMFFTNGALFANLVPRFPEVKTALGLSNSAYGVTIAAFSAGALGAGLASAVLVRRFGSARVAVGGTLATALGVVVTGYAPAAWIFALALFVAGAMDAFTDVGQNAHGLRVQRRYGRSIINTFHAIWSIGSVTGGAMAAAAIALRVPLGIHLTFSGVLFAIVALVAYRFRLRGHDQERAPDAPVEVAAEDAPRLRGRTVAVLVALVLIATAGTTVEDAGSTWAAVYLSGSLGAVPTVAALGFVALVGAQFIGRMAGDALVDRFGQRAVARTGGLLVAVGMGLALGFPSVPGTIAGFAISGLGVATLVPAAMHQADELPGLKHGTGLTMVSWLMRVGFLLSPPIVGAIADATSLRVGLLVVPLAGVLVLLLSGVLPSRRRPGVGQPVSAR